MNHKILRVALQIGGAALLPVVMIGAFAPIIGMPATRVSAHAAYDHSTPAQDEVVATSPATITVVFKEEMTRAEGLPTLTVVADDGDVVSSNATLNDDDRTEMTADLNPGLEDGRYTVIWHNVSADDGDEAQGAFYFYVGEGPSPATGGASATAGATATGGATATVAATATPAPAKSDDSGDIPVWGLIVGIVGGLVVGGGGGLVFGRRG